MLFPNLIKNVPKPEYFKTATFHFIHNNISLLYAKQVCVCSSTLNLFHTSIICFSSHNFRIMSNNLDLISFRDEEEMDVGDSGELGDKGNPGQGIVGVWEDPKNTGKIEMEGVAGMGWLFPLCCSGETTQASLLPTYPILSLRGLPTPGGQKYSAAPAGMCSPCPKRLRNANALLATWVSPV